MAFSLELILKILNEFLLQCVISGSEGFLSSVPVMNLGNIRLFIHVLCLLGDIHMMLVPMKQYIPSCNTAPPSVWEEVEQV